jgi:hypothetical protein
MIVADRYVPGFTNWANSLDQGTINQMVGYAQSNGQGLGRVGNTNFIPNTDFWVSMFGPGLAQDLNGANYPSIRINVDQYGNPTYGGYGQTQQQGWNDRIVGAVLRIIQSWSAFAQQCCLGQGDPTACVAIYGPGNGFGNGCFPIMQQYCDASVANAQSAQCQQWFLTQPGSQTQAMAALCNNPANLTDPSGACQTWCKQNPGQCDNGSASYCANHPTDTYCACITSPVTKYNPACVDTKCIGGGYVTSSMHAMGTCPNVVDCETQVQLNSAGRAVVGNISLQQNCGNTSGSGSGSGSVTGSSGTPGTSGTTGTTTVTGAPSGINIAGHTISPLIIIFMLLILLVIILATQYVGGGARSATSAATVV